MSLRHEDLARWISGYERAWRTHGTEPLHDLFAPEATYRAAPFDPPLRGREAIAAFWESERESADEVFALRWEAVAIEHDTAVARLEVDYGDPPERVYRDLWIVSLDADGRCTAFEEWPFHPGQPRTAPPS